MNKQQLLKTEKYLRKKMAEYLENSNDSNITLKEYEEMYHVWFSLREKGLKAGVFMFFLPNINDVNGK